MTRREEIARELDNRLKNKRKNEISAELDRRLAEREKEREAAAKQRNAALALNTMSKMTGGTSMAPSSTAGTAKSYSPLMVKAGQSSGIDFSSRDKAADDRAVASSVSKLREDAVKLAEDEAAREAADYEFARSYDDAEGKKKQAEAVDAIDGFTKATEKKALELDERMAETSLGVANDSDARREAAAEKASMKRKAQGDAKVEELSELRKTEKKVEKIRNSRGYFEKAALEDPDFAAKSGYASTKYDPVVDKNDYLYNNELGMGYGDLTYEYINNRNGVRGEILGHVNDGGRAYSDLGYEYMTPEQVSIYNYYYATEGREKAEQYLSLISDDLTTALAKERVKSFDDTWKEPFINADAGMRDFGTNVTKGVANFFTGSDEGIERSAYSKASEIARQNNTGAGKVINDLAYTTGNMLPTIGTSALIGIVNPTAGAAVGAGLMGASSAAGSYDEMIKLGYSPSQAQAYGLMVGASEAVLQYALGGIGKLGGKGIEKLIPRINEAIEKLAINHPNLAIFANAGKEMGKEALEEAVQSVLEPLFHAAATGEEFEGIDVSEVLYSALLGALSSGVLEGAPTVITNTPNMVRNVAIGAINKQAVKWQIVKGIDNATLTKDMSGLAVDALKSGVDAVGADRAADYAADFRSAYHAGRLGMPLGAVADSSVMSYSQRQAAYNLGMEDGKAAKSQTDGDLSAELAKDPEIAAVIKQIEAENAAQSGVRSTASRALSVQSDAPKVRAKDFLERGGMLSTDQEVNAKKAESAKTDTARTGYLSGASEMDIHIAESMAKLTGREILFAGEGYEADGEFDGNNTIIVNPKRGSVLSQIIAHELTHSIQGTEEYTSLVNNLKDFVNTYSERGMIADWDTLYSEVWKDYEQKHEELTGEKFDDVKAEKEIVARVMETFFGEGESTSERQVDLTNFIMEFTAANKNAATRIWYELSKLAKRIREDIAHYATKKVWGENYDSSYREHQLMLRKIEDLRDQFGRALMEAKGKPGDGKRAFDIVVLDDGKTYVKASRKVINGTTLDAMRTDVTNFFDDLLDSNPSIDIPTIEGDVLTITKSETGNKARDDYKEINGQRVKMTDVEYAVKVRAEAHIDELSETSNDWGKGRVPDQKNHPFAKDGFSYRTAFFEDLDGQYYRIRLSVGHNGTTATVYNVGKIKKDIPPSAKIIAVVGSKAPMGNVSVKSISPTATKSNKQTVNNSSNKGLSLSRANTTPQNELETKMKAKALSMYAEMRKAQKAQKATDITEESIYEQTGWYFDDYGNFAIDREAPVYVKAAPVKQQRYVENAKKMAESAEAHAAEAYAENAALREDVAKWKARAESAEKAARIIERDAGARIKADRQLSPEYMPSAKQVRGVVKELCDMFGGGYSSKQIGEFSARLMSIYDSISTNARYASDLTNYSKDIAELISDMQDVRLKNEDNAEIAVTLRGELKTPVYLSQKARGDLKGGYGATVRKYGGRVKLTTKERGTPVDVRYMELSAAYPNWFPADIVNEADQLMRMLDVSDTISDRGFASSDRYANIGADPAAVRTKDFDRAMIRILDGYAELEAVPRTFADGLMRQLEFERRESQRELARATDEERERLTKQHEAEIERLVQEAEAAMEWETRYLNDKLSQVYADIRAAEKKAADDARVAREAAIQRAHARGADIQDAAIEAAQADGSFTKKMTELYERHTALEDEIARIQAECKKHDHVDLDAPMSKDERAYIKQLRARRDALIEDKSNLEAYINKVNARVKDIRFKTMCDMIAKENYLKDWKDKAAPIFHAMETMRRNVQDIAPKKGDSAMAKYIIEQILDPITNATYTSTLVQNQVRGRVKELKLATKPHKGDVLSESQFVQAYGEAMDNIDALSKLEGSFIYNRHGEPMREGMIADEWRGYLNRIIEENPGITKDAEKLKHMKESVKVFKDIYDDLFTIVNAARVRNGYAPVPYHRGYFPHYNNDTKQDGVFSSLLKGLGLREQEISEKLPTSINGLTATFRPGIRYMSNAKQRSMAGFEGDRRVTGAVEGLDRYIETATDVAFQTDNIQNLRSLSNAIRYATTKDETKKRVDEIRNDSSLNRDQKQERINEIFANKTDKTKYALNNFIVELEEYTNQLAGKKSARDREYESLIGRSLYTAMKRITGNTAANAIAGNIGSALTNFIPLMDGGAVMHYHMLGAMWDMMQGHIQGDGFISTSQFLTNRRGSDRLIKSGRQAASDVLGSPMNFVDNITSELLMRARVRQNMSKHRGGMSFQAAMNEADTFIAGMMGDRSKGALPTIFGAKNPVYKMFTMYQVEVKNQFGFILKDLPKDSDKGEFIVKMIAMAVLHSLFNDLYEKLVGRRPALDPLHMLNDLGGDLFGWRFEAFDEMFNGDGNIIEKTEKKGIADSVMSFFTTAASEAPFIGGLIGGGRIPISSVMPDWDYLKKAFTGFEKGDGGQKIAENFYKGVSPVFYYGVMPMAGGAVKKVVEGVNAYAKGGSYTYDAEGNRKLQYPVFTDEGAASVGTAVKSAVFGKSSTEGGREWVESGFGTLSVKQTACYEKMVKAGEGQRESWELINQLRSAGKFTGEIDILLDSDIIDEAKEVAFLTFVGTGESMPALLQELRRKKVDIDDFMKVYKVKLTASGNVKEQVLEAINALGISKEKKDAIYLSWYSEKNIDDAPWNSR